MFQALLCALRRHPWLRALGCGFILSSVGNGLTFVIVFGELLRSQAPPSSLALAYLLAFSPGFIGSLLSEKLSLRCSPFALLLLSESLGLCGLALPFWALSHHQTTLLLLTQGVAAFCQGMIVPPLGQLFKGGLKREELPLAAGLETLFFAANVLFGIGLGVLLYGRVATKTLLLLDAMSFVSSLLLLVVAKKAFTRSRPPGPPHPAVPFHWRTLQPRQQRAMLMLPMLALVGSPAMALLPALAPQLPQAGENIGLSLLFARSLGQLFGPFILPVTRFHAMSHSNSLQLGCLCGFILCYLSVPLVPSESIALLLIFSAHVCSNVVFALASYGLMANFSQAQVGMAMARTYRWQILISSASTLSCGLLADRLGASAAIILLSLFGLLLAAGVMANYRRDAGLIE